MGTSTDLKQRTKRYALDVIRMTKDLPSAFTANHISKQMIRSCTSAAANYRAACLAQSKASFIAKLSITIEEVDETVFWLEMIEGESLLENKKIEPFLNEGKELTSIFIKSRITASKRK